MIGKLVRINRASIGVPKGTLGLVTRRQEGAAWWARDFYEGEEDLPPPVIYTVLLCGHKHERRYLVQDLEVMEVVKV